MSQIMDSQSLQKKLNISRTTLYRMEKEGLPVTKLGKSKRYDLEDVKAWIADRQRGISDLIIGYAYSNQEIAKTFKCSTQGGMRRSHATNTLVIFSDHTTSIYEDKPIINDQGEEILLYTGMGQEGDQDINFAQNKTLKESNTNGVHVYLFEAFEPGKHIFRGKVELANDPYPDNQNNRKVWIFPIRVIGNKYVLPQNTIQKKNERKKREVQKLSEHDLEARAKNPEPLGQRYIQTRSFDRDPYVAEYVRQRSNGICENCYQPAPFIRKDFTPYLEVHHKIPLAEGGEDTIENAIAICPNCHQSEHFAADVVTVVAGIVMENNQIMIAQRGGQNELTGKWEFPGGKIEIGETFEQGLRRELQEELNIQTNIQSFLGENIHQTKQKTYRLMAYMTERLSGNYQLNVHQKIRFVDLKNLDHYDFLDADVPLIEKVQNAFQKKNESQQSSFI